MHRPLPLTGGAPAHPFAISPHRSTAWRVPWPLVVLLLSIGLMAVAAFDAQRAVRTQRRVADRALREYANFAAWSYAQHLALALDGVGREVLGAVNHGDNMHTSPSVPDAHDIVRYLRWDDACGCRHTSVGPSPDAYFALGLRSRSFTEDVNAAAGAGPPDIYRSASDSGVQAPADLGAQEAPLRAWVFDSLTPRVRTRGALDRGFRFVIERQTATPRIVAYTLMPLAWGDTMVYGAVYSANSFERILAATLDSRDLLPSAFSEGRASRDVIELAVADRSGHTLFATSDPRKSDLSSRISTSVSSDSLMVDAAVRPEIAGTLLIGGLPPTGIPFPLGLLALAAALSVIAVAQIRREGELARVRAGIRLERLARAADTGGADPVVSGNAAARPDEDARAAGVGAQPYRSRVAATGVPGGERAAFRDARGTSRNCDGGDRPRGRSRAHCHRVPAAGGIARGDDRAGSGTDAAGVRAGGRAPPHIGQPARQRGEVRSIRADGARLGVGG